MCVGFLVYYFIADVMAVRKPCALTVLMRHNVLQLGVRFLAYRNVQVANKLNSQKLTLRCCYSQ